MKKAEGKITFIHHDKNRAVIEYMDNSRKKTIQASLDTVTTGERKTGKKAHRFLVGDQVSFTIKKTGANGSIQYAGNLQYLYNTSLELLLNKAATDNRFLGYIKSTDGTYFIKEIDSYLFFPLQFSKYEIIPSENDMEKPVYFKLENTDKPGKTTASLYNHQYIPEFLTAVKHFKNKEIIHAPVYNITPFGVYVQLMNNRLQAKLALEGSLKERVENKIIQAGSVIPVIIKHIAANRIIIEEAGRAG